MSHPRELLSAFLDGELPPEERQRVDQHLAACSDCADELRELALVDDWARAHEVEAPPGYFEALPGRVRVRLRQGDRNVRPRRGLPQWAWAAAALMLIGLLIPLTWPRRTFQAPVPQDGAAAPHSVEDAPSRANGPAAAPPAPLGAPERAPSQADRRDAERAVASELPTEADARPPAPGPAGFAPPPAAPPASDTRSAGVQARDELKALGYIAKQESDEAPASQEELRREQVAEPAVLAEQVDGRLADKEDRDAPAPQPAAAGAAAPVPGAGSDDGFEARRQAQPFARGEGSRAGLSAKRKLEAAPGATVSPRGGEFEALLARRAHDAAQARALRLAWRAFAEAQPTDPRADEARVRAIEAAAQAFELSGEPADREVFERDAADYRRRADARQKPRVRKLEARR